MVVIYSSFFVGMLTSGLASFVLLEKVRDRRLAFDPKIDEKELDRYIYNSMLYERMRRVKEDRMMESDVQKQARMFVNDNVVAGVQTGANAVFESSPVTSVRKMLGI
jgi:hypothetical protein